MKKIKVTLAFLCCLVLAGCATPPPLNFSTPNVGYSETKIPAEVKSMTVTLARPDEAKGNISWGMEAIPQLWQEALQEALNRMAIFQDGADEKVNIAVKILGLDAPGAGFSMTTKAIARYEIIDRSNGDMIYTQEISSDGTVPMGYAYLGTTRARESINRAVQNNITQFLQALETVDVNKPMFPRDQQK